MPGRRGSFAKKIDQVHWTLIQEGWTALAAGAVAFNAGVAQHLPETILRIRGEWAATLAGSQASAVGVSVAAGLILVPEGTGTTVLWSPLSDGDAPWMWWDTMSLMYSEFVTDVVWSSNVSDGRRVVDSKAMRKVRNRELQLVVEQATMTGLSAASIQGALTARVLAGS